MTNTAYPSSIRFLIAELRDLPHSELRKLALLIILRAIDFDTAKTKRLPTPFKLHSTVRNLDNPPDVEIADLVNAPWEDNPSTKLEVGETWNEGRRATYTGMLYNLDGQGRPINPYMQTGLKGRGVLGRFGPNLAVDNGVVLMRPDERGEVKLQVMGILRRYDNDAPAFSGGFADFMKQDDGSYLINRETTIRSQARECFEEMISGSIPLLPDYAEHAKAAFEKAVAARPEADHEELRAQCETEAKMEQVENMDPEFLVRLEGFFAAAKLCFAGPVINDPRTTDTAWIETSLSWRLMDDSTWKAIRGDAPAFDYQFAAGDDASDVVAHTLSPELIEKAYASHGAMFAFLTASVLIDAEIRGEILPQSVVTQASDIAAYLQSRI